MGLMGLVVIMSVLVVELEEVGLKAKVAMPL